MEASQLRAAAKIKAPRLVSLIQQTYPKRLRRARIEGSVVIHAVIDKEGNVVGAHAVSGNELLIPAAMAVLRRWKHEPLTLDGQAFPVLLRVTVAFRLDGEG